MIRIESIIICNNLLIATTPTGRVKRTRDPKNYYIILKLKISPHKWRLKSSTCVASFSFRHVN